MQTMEAQSEEFRLQDAMQKKIEEVTIHKVTAGLRVAISKFRKQKQKTLEKTNTWFDEQSAISNVHFEEHCEWVTDVEQRLETAVSDNKK